MSKKGKGVFHNLKSIFTPSPQCKEIKLTKSLKLCKESIRVSVDDCPIDISFGNTEKPLQLIPEQFITDRKHIEKPALLLSNPSYNHNHIGAFIRITEGDHLIIGGEDEKQHVLFKHPNKIAPRHLAITHEGDTLIFKDLIGKQGIILSPVTDDGWNTTKRRIHNLREIRRIFRGPIKLLSTEQALHDLKKVTTLLEREPMRPLNERGMPGGVVEIPKNMVPIIIGDLHAQINNLLTLLTQNSFLEMLSEGKAAMVFLGDAIHSEMDGHLNEMESSLLMMDIIFRLKLWFPQQVFYVRGNHDSFSEEIGKAGVPQGLLWAQNILKYRGKEYKKLMDRFYELLPYIALSKDYAACHAAPPRGKVTVDMLINIHKYPGLINEITCNRIYRPNRLGGYTKGDVKRFRKSLKLRGKAELFVGHTPLTRDDTLWLNIGGIKHHDVVFSGNMPWVGIFTRVKDQMIPLKYRSESLLDVLNDLNDVDLYDELEHGEEYNNAI